MKPRLRDLSVARALQHQLVAADEHGDVAGAHLESIEQRLDGLVLLQVDVRVRLTVAPEELANAERCRRVARPDQHSIAAALRDEADPPQDEGAHHQLAQLGVRLNDLAQRLRAEHQQLAGSDHARADEARPPGQHVDFAGELARTLERDGDFPAVHEADDRQLTGEHDEEIEAGVALVVDDFSGHHVAEPAQSGQPRDLGGGEGGKHLLAPIVGHGASLHPARCGCDPLTERFDGVQSSRLVALPPQRSHASTTSRK